MSSCGGSFFVLFKAVLKVGAQAMVPFKRLFKRKMGRLPGRLLGTITKEKGPDDSFSLLRLFEGYQCTKKAFS